jgi:hypothetical protein
MYSLCKEKFMLCVRCETVYYVMVFSDQHEILPYVQYSQSHTYLKYFSCTNCCSSADEEEDPDTKAAREKERRQANNARER